MLQNHMHLKGLFIEAETNIYINVRNFNFFQTATKLQALLPLQYSKNLLAYP
jgi:hypothetical protein